LLGHGYGWLRPPRQRGGQAKGQPLIRIEQSKGRKDRNVILSPETFDLFVMVEGVANRVTMSQHRWRNAGCLLATGTWMRGLMFRHCLIEAPIKEMCEAYYKRPKDQRGRGDWGAAIFSHARSQ
jgi:hypothetical protein